MDKLRPLGCCHIYSARDYTLEGDGGNDGGNSGGLAPLKTKGGEGGALSPPSPGAMARWAGAHARFLFCCSDGSAAAPPLPGDSAA